MFIHVRLRDGNEDDIIDWYEEQTNKSAIVREALRLYIRAQNGASQEDMLRRVIGRELSRLEDVVATTLRETLATCDLPASSRVALLDRPEDPELAARLDEQLDCFFVDM